MYCSNNSIDPTEEGELNYKAGICSGLQLATTVNDEIHSLSDISDLLLDPETPSDLVWPVLLKQCERAGVKTIYDLRGNHRIRMFPPNGGVHIAIGETWDEAVKEASKLLKEMSDDDLESHP